MCSHPIAQVAIQTTCVLCVDQHRRSRPMCIYHVIREREITKWIDRKVWSSSILVMYLWTGKQILNYSIDECNTREEIDNHAYVHTCIQTHNYYAPSSV